MRVIREIRLFLLAILLPAVIVAAGGVRLLVYMWESMWAEERRELEVRAYFIAGEIEDRIHDMEGDHHPHLLEDHPPRHPDDRLTSEKRMVIAAVCEDVLKERSGLEGDVSFEVTDKHGERIFATSGWPVSPSVVGESHLGPPAGNGTLRVARVDGSAMRNRAVAIAASGAVIVLLLVAALVSGGVLLVRTLRRERRESRMKTDFIDNVSHELNTPLAGIRLRVRSSRFLRSLTVSRAWSLNCSTSAGSKREPAAIRLRHSTLRSLPPGQLRRRALTPSPEAART